MCSSFDSFLTCSARENRTPQHNKTPGGVQGEERGGHPAANVQSAPLICYTEIMLPAHRIWIVLVLFSGWLGLPLAAPADPPDGYYDSVDSTDSVVLRTTLHEVIDDHQRFPYTSGSTDTWDILNLADEDPSNSGNILDVYRNAGRAAGVASIQATPTGERDRDRKARERRGSA